MQRLEERSAAGDVVVEVALGLLHRFPGRLVTGEVDHRIDLGSSAVKIFPAGRLGPGYLKDLKGPYPEVRLLPSGGITAANARDYLAAGALAVCCGTSVVPAAAVETGDWVGITERAREFSRALTK
jgi:2-dehydro-3-deoxyphosphogluconate aldolase/(4S)-4-hydroxy-2-oxoglutarate aldolase